MKILITADLHGKWSWYEWLSQRQVDLIVIAGDLIDLLACDDHEIECATAFLAGFHSPIAVASGNHDNPFSWFPRLNSIDILTDGQSRFYGDLLVTSLPFDETDPGDNDVILHDAQKRVGQHPWLVIHHDPPYGSPVGGKAASTKILRQIRQYRPDYLASGHWHNQPYVGSWYSKVGPTICFNAGRPEIPAIVRPNCIYLDTSLRRAWWMNTYMWGKATEYVAFD